VLNAAVYELVSWGMPMRPADKVVCGFRSDGMKQGIVGVGYRPPQIDLSGCSATSRRDQPIRLLQQLVRVRDASSASVAY